MTKTIVAWTPMTKPAPRREPAEPEVLATIAPLVIGADRPTPEPERQLPVYAVVRRPGRTTRGVV